MGRGATKAQHCVRQFLYSPLRVTHVTTIYASLHLQMQDLRFFKQSYNWCFHYQNCREGKETHTHIYTQVICLGLLLVVLSCFAQVQSPPGQQYSHMSWVSLRERIFGPKRLAGPTKKKLHLTKASGVVYRVWDKHAGSQKNVSIPNMSKQIIACYPSSRDKINTRKHQENRKHRCTHICMQF